MYRQVKKFDPAKMGKRKGWCLANVAKGYEGCYGNPNAKESAKADMESQKAAGTLHDISTLPNNVSVPIYVDSTSKYEHVIVHTSDGKYYEDGKECAAPKNTFGWGEYCNGVRVVEFVPDEKPKPTVDNSVIFAVIRGDYGNGTDRIYRLKAAGYDPDEVQRGVNNYLKNTAQPKYYTVQAGDNLTKIAQKFGTTVDKLVTLNSIPNRNLIYIGQKLRVA